jgi:general secretion pathway protein G
MHKTKYHKSFTLIEMMLVIVILGIIMSAMTFKVRAVIGKARDVARIRDITTLATALNLYYMDNNSYPAHVPNPSA